MRDGADVYTTLVEKLDKNWTRATTALSAAVAAANKANCLPSQVVFRHGVRLGRMRWRFHAATDCFNDAAGHLYDSIVALRSVNIMLCTPYPSNNMSPEFDAHASRSRVASATPHFSRVISTCSIRRPFFGYTL